VQGFEEMSMGRARRVLIFLAPSLCLGAFAVSAANLMINGSNEVEIGGRGLELCLVISNDVQVFQTPKF
jgi:hypothetical protein